MRAGRTLRAAGLGGLLALEVVAAGGGEALIEFEIEDQFGRSYQSADYADRVLVILASDREGSQFNSAWATAIREALEDDPGYERVAMLGLADLGGVPRFIRGMVRRAFPKDRDKGVLLDWQGVFDGAYGVEPGHSNLLIFAADGVLLRNMAVREVAEEPLAEVLAVLRSQLSPALLGGRLSSPGP